MRIVKYFFYCVTILLLFSATTVKHIHGTYSGNHENGSSYILVLEEGEKHSLSITKEHLHSHFKGEYRVEANKLILQNKEVTVVDKRVKKPTVTNNSDVIVFTIKDENLWDVKEKICLKKQH